MCRKGKAAAGERAYSQAFEGKPGCPGKGRRVAAPFDRLRMRIVVSRVGNTRLADADHSPALTHAALLPPRVAQLDSRPDGFVAFYEDDAGRFQGRLDGCQVAGVWGARAAFEIGDC